MVNTPWTSDEDDIVREFWPKGRASACKQRLPGRSLAAVEWRASILKLRASTFPWTTREDLLLRKFWPINGLVACQPHLPDRTPGAIQVRAGFLKLRIEWMAWTPAEQEVVRKFWPAGGAAACEDHLPNRNANAINQRAWSLGLHRAVDWRSPFKPGQRVGLLVLIKSRKPNRKGRPNAGHRRWLCQCDCGRRCVKASNNIRRHPNPSCGCANFPSKTTYDDAVHVCYRTYRSNAKRRGITFALSIADVKRLVSSPCHYCGSLPARTMSGYEKWLIGGIDRKDNELYYRKTNALPCCTRCNVAKGTMKYVAFIAWLDRVAGFRGPRSPVLGERSSSDTLNISIVCNDADATHAVDLPVHQGKRISLDHERAAARTPPPQVGANNAHSVRDAVGA